MKEFDEFFSLTKEIRDAIAHPSPIEDPITGRIKKLEMLFSLDLETVTKIVTSSILLVKRIEKRVKSNPWMEWLIGIDSKSGLFPDEAFK